MFLNFFIKNTRENTHMPLYRAKDKEENINILLFKYRVFFHEK